MGFDTALASAWRCFRSTTASTTCGCIGMRQTST